MKNRCVKLLIFASILVFMTSCTYEIEYSQANDYIKTQNAKLSIVLPNSYPDYKWSVSSFPDDKRFIEYDINNASISSHRHFEGKGNEAFTTERYVLHNYTNKKPCTDDYHMKYSLIEDKSKNIPVSEFYHKYIFDKYIHRKDYIDYIAGLKCHTYFKTEIIPGEYDIEGDYRSCCLYYNTNNELIVLDIHSAYDNGSGDINSNIQQIFKSDMKEIYDSLKLHDIDVQKSKEAGFYYDKPFDLNAEDKPIKMFMSKEFLEDLKDLELEQKIKQNKK